MSMSLLSITQKLASLLVSNHHHVRCRTGAAVCTFLSSETHFNCSSNQRYFHGSYQCLKNFNSKLPKNIKIGLYRLPADFDSSKYTIEALETAKTGGRGPDGRIWIHKIGGGVKRKFRWVDFSRAGPKDGKPLTEKVYEVIKDDWRSASIALVASGNHKRWILASENMKPGDFVKSSGVVTAMPVRPQEGDAHPVGSLPLGTLVHNIEPVPEAGGLIARAAGTSGVYVRRLGDKCVIRMPSKREIIVSQECMVTVGKVSNVDHHKTKKMKSPAENRRRGRRPSSGWWQRKTGYHGRKIRPIKPAVVHTSLPPEFPEAFPFTVKFN